MESDSEQSLDISKMKVPDLRRELKARGMSTSGNKTDLMERLQKVLNSKQDDAVEESVDDLEEDLLNDDDDEHLDGNESVMTDIDASIEISTNQRPLKRKSEEGNHDHKPVKKIILNRTSSNSDYATPNTSGEITLDESKTEEKKVVKLSELSAKERLELRAKKFGALVTGDVVAKKAARAERFGLSSTSSNLTSTSPTVNLDQLKQRAERFGTSATSTISKLDNEERIKKRQERFGVVSTNGSSNNQSKMQQRLERFKQIVK